MSKVELSAYERFAEPQEVDVLTILPNKKELGKLFKKDAKAISDALEALPECEWEAERRGCWCLVPDGGWAGGRAGIGALHRLDSMGCLPPLTPGREYRAPAPTA